MRDRETSSWQTPGRLWGRLKTQVRHFRQEPTGSESILWSYLRRRKLRGHRFRRQHPIGQFIVDFYCWKARLVIEVDGPIHQSKQTEDHERDRYLESQAIRVLHFSNDQVQNSTASVISQIENALGPG